MSMHCTASVILKRHVANDTHQQSENVERKVRLGGYTNAPSSAERNAGNATEELKGEHVAAHFLSS